MPPEGTGAAATAGSDATSGQPGSGQQQQPGQQQTPPSGQPGQAAGQQNGATPDDASSMSTDAGREALRKERQRADLAEKTLKDLQEKDLPAHERTARRLAEVEPQLGAKDVEIRSLKTQNGAIKVAIKLGFGDPDDALGYLALNGSKVDYDDANAPTNLEALLKDLLKAKPHLARGAQGAGPGSADGGSRGGAATDMNSRIREMAGR